MPAEDIAQLQPLRLGLLVVRLPLIVEAMGHESPRATFRDYTHDHALGVEGRYLRSIILDSNPDVLARWWSPVPQAVRDRLLLGGWA